MQNFMKEITPDMTRTVDDLKRRNFENATPEEIEIYAQWTQINAMQAREFQENARIRSEESAQRKAAFEKQANSALEALEILKDAALAKLKAVENG